MDYCHQCQRHLNGALACAGCGTPVEELRYDDPRTPGAAHVYELDRDEEHPPTPGPRRARGQARRARETPRGGGRREAPGSREAARGGGRRARRRRGRKLLIGLAALVLAAGALSLAELAIEHPGEDGPATAVRQENPVETEPAPEAPGDTDRPEGPGPVNRPGSAVPVSTDPAGGATDAVASAGATPPGGPAASASAPAGPTGTGPSGSAPAPGQPAPADPGSPDGGPGGGEPGDPGGGDGGSGGGDTTGGGDGGDGGGGDSGGDGGPTTSQPAPEPPPQKPSPEPTPTEEPCDWWLWWCV
ncbi:hypothetical protein ACLGI4_20450 [Streptomyces sp. HMX112]|uniref:SCO2400 family protein n=1 Tax=Streptomyces sp. HMX112 TaxID=3390850 RepID=UPI003A7FD445